MKKSLLFVAVMLLAMQTMFAQDYALKFDAVNETQSLKYKEDTYTQKLDGKNNFTSEIWVFPTNDTKSGEVIFSIRNTFRLTFWKNNSDADVLGRVYVTLKEDVNDDGKTIKNTFVCFMFNYFNCFFFFLSIEYTTLSYQRFRSNCYLEYIKIIKNN